MKVYSEEIIKSLIKKGFDITLISFELNVPIEQVKQYQREIEESKKYSQSKTLKAKEIIQKETIRAHSMIERIRRKYRKLYTGQNKAESETKTRKIDEQEAEKINIAIAEIEKILQKIEGKTRNERHEGAWEIIKILKAIEEMQLNLKQAEKLYNLIQSQELDKLRKDMRDRIDSTIYKKRAQALRKFVDEIDYEQSQTQDLEELKQLERKITPQMLHANMNYVGRIKDIMARKRQNITQKNAVNKIRSDESAEIKTLIQNLSNGSLDIIQAKRIIDEEAKKRVESGPKNKFALTEEQQKRQIAMKIRKILDEKAEQYQIINPEKAIEDICELFGNDLGQAIRTVVTNLTNRKEFETAKRICNEYYKKDKNSPLVTELTVLGREIRHAEIGNIILETINGKKTSEEERNYIEMIEKGIEKGNIKPLMVSLGKSQDGLKNITLADVWVEANIEEKVL